MTPKTRSHVQSERVYSSEPRLQQKRFPARRRRTRLSTPSAPPTTRGQGTLTQMDSAATDATAENLRAETDDEGDWNDPRPKKKRRTRMSDTKRQQTLTQLDFAKPLLQMGHYEGTEHDVADAEENQTVGQMARNPKTARSPLQRRRAPTRLQVEDTEDREPSISQLSSRGVSSRGGSSPARAISTSVGNSQAGTENAIQTKSPTPRTPRNKRILEIPSSQTPAATPLVLHDLTKSGRCTRSPLQQRSSNEQLLQDSPSNRRVQFFNDNRAKRIIQNSYPEYDTQDENLNELSTNYDMGPETQGLLKDMDASSSPRDGADPSDIGGLAGYDDELTWQGATATEHSFDFDLEVPICQYESLRDGSQARPLREDAETDSRVATAKVHGTSRAVDVGLALDGETQDSASAQLLSDMNEYTQRQVHRSPAPTVPFMMIEEREQRSLGLAPPESDSLPGEGALPTAAPVEPSFHPSQATTVDITQPSVRKLEDVWASSKLPKTPKRRKSPTLPSSPNMPSSPSRPFHVQETPSSFPLPPSPPIVTRPSKRSRPLNGRNEKDGAHVEKKDVVTISQLLPESLMNYTIPLPPPWTQEEEEGQDSHVDARISTLTSLI